MKNFSIGSKKLGKDERVYFIADIAANHDGDISRAKHLIELAKESGADAAKFQHFQAPKIVSKVGFDLLGRQLAHQAKWKKSVYEVYKAAEVDQQWTAALKAHCDQVGIEFFTSPYDKDSVDHINPFVGAYKIGSGDITFVEMIEYIAQKQKPVFIATGASTLSEVAMAVGSLKKAGGPTLPICIMQCNTNYTGDTNNFRYINLNVLKTFELLFPDALLGLSDHTPHHATVLGAIALGARAIEKHFTDDNSREGPDHLFSMNPASWKEMIGRARELEFALGTSEKKVEPNEQDSLIVQRRALYATCSVDEGASIERHHLEALRPAPMGSILPYEIDAVVGKKACKHYSAGDRLQWSDWIK